MQPVEKKTPRSRRVRPWVAAVALLVLLGVVIAAVLLTRRELPAPESDTLYGELLHHTPAEVASLTLTLRDGERYTLTQHVAGKLLAVGEDEFEVSDLYAPGLLQAASVVAYEQVLAEDGAAYAEYRQAFGLTQPRVMAEISYTDGTSVTLSIGDPSPLEEDTWYYMEVAGDERLFAVDQDTAEELEVSRDSLRPVEQPILHAERMDELQLQDAQGNIVAQWRLEGGISAVDAASGWRMTVPYPYPADEEAMTSLRKNLANLRLGICVGEATPENLRACGLDTPRFTITVHQAAGAVGQVGDDGAFAAKEWPESTLTVQVGSAKNDVVDYVRVGDNIYQCAHYLLSIFMNYAPLDSISRYPVMVKMEALASLTVTTAEGSTVYALRREEQVGENNDLLTDAQGNVLWTTSCTRDGEAISADAFAAAWEQLRAVRVTGLLPEGYTAAQPPHTTFRMTTTTGRTHTLALTPYDALHDAVLVDGAALFYLYHGGLNFDVK